ncbi:MAG: thioredoxin domain-containing protein, partial [Myxococcales bacterium]|nr:thioredoxin domain-containing protein [Myxococcales bacterium]
TNYPDRYEFEGMADLPRKGPADAPIQIVEISDFQCPFCARLRLSLEEVMAEYPDQVAIYFVNYPLSNQCNP